MIRFDRIHQEYKQHTVLQSISFEVAKGDLAVLIGPSGCGKTTLLKMINRLITPTSGTIYIDGKDVAGQDVISLRRNIGYVIQQTGLFPHLTVRENIEIIPRLQKRNEGDIVRKSRELMEMVGLPPDDFLDRYPTQLSGGQQQRVGVARAFACDQEVILMDEPFSALDPITRNQLQEQLVTLQSEVRKTIVFVTHDMDEAVKIADRICLLNAGKVVQYGTPEEIMKNPVDDFVVDFVGPYRIWTAPEFITAKDIMITNPVVGRPDMSAVQCLKRMRAEQVNSLVIVDGNDKILGYVYRDQLCGETDKTLKASQVMRTDFREVRETDNIVDILQMVHDQHLSAVPVINGQGRLTGLLTKNSLMTSLSQKFIQSAEVM